VSAIRDPNGNIIGASKIARDISEQKLSEELIRRNAENQDILNAIGKAISGNFDVEAILQKVTDACTKLVDAQFGAFFYNTINESGEPFRLFTLSGTAREAFFGRDMPQHTEIYGIPFNDKDIYRSDDITKDQQYDHPRRNEIPGSHLHVTSYLSVPVVSKEGSVVGGLFFGHSEPAKFTHQHERLMEGVSSQAAIALDNAKLVNEVRVLNSKKDEFIGLASHELKTPVTSIKGYLQILEKNQDISGMSRTFIAKALQQTDKLAGLISDLLDVSKIEAGKLPLNLAVFDLGELIKDVIEVLGHEYHSHRIEFTVEHGPLLVHADRSRIEQVIINLLSNAVKYSPAAGHVVVRGNHTEGQIIVSVRDFGIGIQKQHQSNIFSRFYRVDDLAHHISGLGIGLYISNEIIIRHHGAMWVESEFEKGSTFYFSLPPAGQ
jgi:signal transduction histidine kinase